MMSFSEGIRLISQKDLRENNDDLCFIFNELSKKLGTDEALRRELPDTSPSFWDSLSYNWNAVRPDLTTQVVPYDLALSLARLTRNLVAGVPSNQNKAYAFESDIRSILHNLTSFVHLEDEAVYPLTRMLVQTLSNIVTLNDSLGARLWNLYSTLSDDQNVIVRLLSSSDTRTINAALVLILNSINAQEQALSRLTSPSGQRILIRLLDRTEEWVSNESERGEEDEVFTLSYRFFETLLDRDFAKTIFHSLSMEDEPITPHQTTFLKILDSYLQHATTVSDFHDYSFLAETLSELCSYSQRSIRRSLGIDSVHAEPQSQADIDLNDHAIHNSAHGLRELDMRLPKVSVAMVLLSQCLNTLLLQNQKFGDIATTRHGTYSDVVESTQASGFIECIVETLRLLDHFLPRIAFGKAVVTSGESTVPSGSSGDTKGFEYLKRDLVHLLGTICYERREIQNRIRECGGIQVVMNLCVIDERNPYLQEHSLFALRNILHQNPENQAIVEALRPAEQFQT